MKRLLTAAVTVPVALAAIFLLPPLGFFLALLLVTEVETFEFVRLTRAWTPTAPRSALLVLVPAAAVLLSPMLVTESGEPVSWEYLLTGAFALSVGVGAIVLFGGTEAHEAVPALGVLGFGTVYLALPVASLAYLQRLDPWLVFLLCAIVWLGDTAAYYCGSRWGRRKLSRFSPNKSWEGAIGSLTIALVSAAVWSAWRLGEVRPALLSLAAATSIAGQTGDLVESMIKRGAGMKDSGDLLPGHGGMLDRMDAMLFAAPAMVVLLWMMGVDRFLP